MTEEQITFTEINGVKIAQAVAGEGVPVLMLHGWGANVGWLWPLAERLVAQGYRV